MKRLLRRAVGRLCQGRGREALSRLGPWWFRNHYALRYPIAYVLLGVGGVVGVGSSLLLVYGVLTDSASSWWLAGVIGMALGWALLSASTAWCSRMEGNETSQTILARATELGWRIEKPHLLSAFDAWLIAQGLSPQEQAQRRAQKLEKRLPPSEPPPPKRPRF